MRAMAEMNAGDYEFLTSASILAGTALFRLTDRPIIMTECDFHIQKNGQLSPCADKTVIWRNYKIGICQTGSDNKTDDIQLRLGVVCFCAFKGWKSLIFCSVMHCSKTGISDFIYSFDLIWKRKNCYYSANRLHELKKQNRVKDFRSVAKFFTKTTTTMFFVSKTSKNILSCVLFEHFFLN